MVVATEVVVITGSSSKSEGCGVDEPLDTDEDEEDLAPARLTVGLARRLRLLVIDATEGVGEVLVR